MRCGSGSQRRRPSLREAGEDLAVLQEGIAQDAWRRQLQIRRKTPEGQLLQESQDQRHESELLQGPQGEEMHQD